MTKQQAREILKKGRAEAKAAKPPNLMCLRFNAAYIRSNRRDLGQAYKLLHPNMPAVKNWNWWNA